MKRVWIVCIALVIVCSVAACAYGEPVASIASPSPPITVDGRTVIDIPVIRQFPNFPTGCESVTAVMALRYAGVEITVDDFVDDYLPCSRHFYWYNGKYHGPNPEVYFLGNPRSDNSYGCMAPVIEKTLGKVLGSSAAVRNVSGTALEVLCKTYIDYGYPVMVWASINMLEIRDGRQWVLPDGSLYTWPANEHCMLLVGYDAINYYFNDPYKGEVLCYDRALSEARYERMGKQALVLQ